MTSTSDIFAAGVALAARRDRAEVAVIEAALSSPVPAVPLLTAAGISAETFINPDLAILIAAAVLGVDKPIETTLCAARLALQHFGYWDPSAPIGTGSRWSDESLVLLATACPPLPMIIVARAAELLEVVALQSEVATTLERLDGLLSGEVRPAPAVPRASVKPVIVMPLRRKGAA